MKTFHTFFVLIVATQSTAIVCHNEPQEPAYFERALHSPYFVDKTTLLRTFWDGYNKTAISCPEHFGKSTNLDMIRRFFQIPFNKTTGQPIDKTTTHYYHLFSNDSLNLEITKDRDFVEEHQGEHPVLYLNFTDIQGTTLDQIMSSIRNRIRELFTSHQWLFNIMEDRYAKRDFDIFEFELNRFDLMLGRKINRKIIKEGVQVLVEFLKLHFHTDIIILVDDYDYPIRHALNNGVNAEKIDELIEMILTIFVQATEYVSRIMFVGQCRMFKKPYFVDYIFTLHYNYFLDDYGYADYFGFTAQEVDRLLSKKQVNQLERTKIKNYFNGYHTKRELKPIYQPHGIVRYLETGKIVHHELTNDLVPKIMKCLHHRKFFEQACELFSKKRVTAVILFNLHKVALSTLAELVRTNCSYEKDIPYFTPFLDNGYLSFTDDEDEYEIPNEIIRQKLRHEFELFYTKTLNVSIINAQLAKILSPIFKLENTTDEMIAKLNETLYEVMQPSREIHYRLKEFDFYSLIFGAIAFNLEVHSNIRVRREGDKREFKFDDLERLKFLDDQSKILVIIKLTSKKDVQKSLDEVIKFIPHKLPDQSAVKLVKYFAINLDARFDVQIVKGENRYNW